MTAARARGTRLRILEAAGRCFLASGFARTRMDDIADAAGVSRALVHRYFAAKPNLLRCVCEHALDEWGDAVEIAIAEAPGAKEALATWVRVNLEYASRAPLLQLVFDRAVLAAPDAQYQVLTAMHVRLAAQLGPVLERGVIERQFRFDLDVAATVELLQGIFAGWMNGRPAGAPPSQVGDQRKIDATVHLLVHGLRSAKTDTAYRAHV